MQPISRQLVSLLKEAGMRHVFGIPSIHSIGLYDALRDEPSIRHILCRNESMATHMADGYARAGTGPGLILSSTGPGAAYMLPGLMEAQGSLSPVFALTTTIASGDIGCGKGALHETDHQDRIFTDVTKARFRPRSADEVLPLAGEALKAVRRERPGPVYCEVPTDLWDREEPVEERPKPFRDEEAPALFGDVAHARTLLQEAERPILIAGTGALRAGIGPLILEIAEMLQAPVFTSAEAKGILPEDHPLSFGNAARKGVAREALEAGTVALAVGTRLRQVDFSLRGAPLPLLIHADSDDRHMDRNYPAHLRLSGPLETIARELLRELGTGGRPSGGTWAKAMRSRLREERQAIGRRQREVAFIDAMRTALPPEGTLVVDSTILGYWAEYFFHSCGPGRLVSARGSSIIGFSFPAALGFKLARPECPVAALTGDGGFFYGAQEITTCLRHGVGFPVVVVNDGSFGVIEILQRRIYGREFETGLVNPDLQAFAASFGVAAERVYTPEELARALARAFEAGDMRLIELVASFQEIPFERY